MGKKLAGKELEVFRGVLMANYIEIDALAQLLIEKGLITEQEFLIKLKKVQADYQRRQKNAQ